MTTMSQKVYHRFLFITLTCIGLVMTGKPDHMSGLGSRTQYLKEMDDAHLFLSKCNDAEDCHGMQFLQSPKTKWKKVESETPNHPKQTKMSTGSQFNGQLLKNNLKNPMEAAKRGWEPLTSNSGLNSPNNLQYFAGKYFQKKRAWEPIGDLFDSGNPTDYIFKRFWKAEDTCKCCFVLHHAVCCEHCEA